MGAQTVKMGLRRLGNSTKATDATDAQGKSIAKGSAVKRTKRTKLVETDVDDNDRAPAKVLRQGHRHKDDPPQDKEESAEQREKEIPGRSRKKALTKATAYAQRDSAADEGKTTAEDSRVNGKGSTRGRESRSRNEEEQDSEVEDIESDDDDGEDEDFEMDDGAEDEEEDDVADICSDEEEEEKEDMRPMRRSRKPKSTKKTATIVLKRKREGGGERRLRNLLLDLLEGAADKKEKAESKSDVGGDKLTKPQKKSAVKYCQDTLRKSSYYPSSSAIDKAAKELARDALGSDKPPLELRLLFEKEVRNIMSRQVRAPTATAIKESVRQRYADVAEADYATTLEGAAYRKEGAAQYGSKAFVGVLSDVFGPEGKDGKLKLSASEVAFCELGVHLFLNKRPEFPRDTVAGRKDREAYTTFLDAAAAGINEPQLIIKAKKTKATE